jgi:hypothetical protein
LIETELFVFSSLSVFVSSSMFPLILILFSVFISSFPSTQIMSARQSANTNNLLRKVEILIATAPVPLAVMAGSPPASPGREELSRAVKVDLKAKMARGLCGVCYPVPLSCDCLC